MSLPSCAEKNMRKVMCEAGDCLCMSLCFQNERPRNEITLQNTVSSCVGNILFILFSHRVTGTESGG